MAGVTGLPLSADDSIRALERAEDKVAAWPHTHDDRAVVICAGKVFGVTVLEQIPARIVSFS